MDNAAILDLQTSSMSESQTVDLKKVKLNRHWSFWENYETKNKAKNQDYAQLLEQIYSFNDLISFWQFWNKYPGAMPSNIFFNGEYLRYFFKKKYRIIAMNLFEKGIRPEWEDESNKGGKVLTLEYTVSTELNRFMTMVEEAWTNLLLNLIGENIYGVQYINGIRFIDKTQMGEGKKILFRFEIWVNKSISPDELISVKEYLAKNFGCAGITVKDIK